MDPKEINVSFFALTSMLASACWQQLGKASSPEDGSISKDLDGSQSTIDMLLMLQDKTRGNLTGTEEKLLADVIASLQENYAEAAASGDTL